MTIIWLILSVLLWGLFHSLLASLKAKHLARRWFGEGFMRFYRLGYNLLAGLSLLPVLALAALTPDRQLYRVPLPWSVVMVAGQASAAGFLVVGLLQTGLLDFIGLRQLISPASSQSGKLVTRGLYRYVRHPLYTAGLVFIWLFPVMTVNLLTAFAVLTIYIVIGAYFEERRLRREYEQAYVNYQTVTPMLIPFLKGSKPSQ